MEKKLKFFLNHVRFGQTKYYQDWFHKQHFSTPESQMLKTDVIRYILTCIHPPNEVIASDVFPRWAMIGWILNTCQNDFLAYAYSRFALYLDWLPFDERGPPNNMIMDIEPGILVIHFSLKNYPGLSLNLLEFLCLVSFLVEISLSQTFSLCLDVHRILLCTESAHSAWHS